MHRQAGHMHRRKESDKGLQYIYLTKNHKLSSLNYTKTQIWGEQIEAVLQKRIEGNRTNQIHDMINASS